VVWKDVDIVQSGSMSSPGPSRLSNGTPAVGEMKDAQRVDNGNPVLPKILNPTKGATWMFRVYLAMKCFCSELILRLQLPVIY
jgi:hypothetical protein